MRWILRLYPHAWRQRYGEEMEEMLDAEPVRIGTFLDLLAGALDAHLNPQWTPTPSTADPGPSSQRRIATMLQKLHACESRSGLSSKEAAGWIVGFTLASVGLALILEKTMGESLLSETLLMTAFPVGLLIAEYKGTAARRPPRHSHQLVFWTLLVVMYAVFFGIVRYAG